METFPREITRSRLNWGWPGVALMPEEYEMRVGRMSESYEASLVTLGSG